MLLIKDLKISLLCLNPGIAFSFLRDENQQKPHSLLLTSGTLTPLKSFESELMLHFPIQLINKHVINTKVQVNLDSSQTNFSVKRLL